jgi:uncharacterized protein (TIGR03435 family)
MRMTLFQLAAIALAAAPAFAQPPAPLTFDVVSAKKVDPSLARRKFTMVPNRSGGNLHWVMSLPMLVLYAYRAQMWSTAGLEIDDGFYQVDATTDAAATDDQIREMLRTMLAERFQLATHRESRELNGYTLTVGKGRAKIRPVAEGEQSPPLPEYLKGNEKFLSYYEGKVLHTSEGPGLLAITARGVSMAELARGLQDSLGAFVADQTGLAGKYYIGLTYSPEPGDGEIPALSAALQEQLGLKLEKRQGPVDVLVIDRLDKVPAGN